MRPADPHPIITGVETMRAVRKLALDVLASGEGCMIVLAPGGAS